MIISEITSINNSRKINIYQLTPKGELTEFWISTIQCRYRDILNLTARGKNWIQISTIQIYNCRYDDILDLSHVYNIYNSNLQIYTQISKAHDQTMSTAFNLT